MSSQHICMYIYRLLMLYGV